MAAIDLASSVRPSDLVLFPVVFISPIKIWIEQHLKVSIIVSYCMARQAEAEKQLKGGTWLL